jgi:hypothetical protein
LGLTDRPQRLLPIPAAYVGARRRRGFDIDESNKLVPSPAAQKAIATIRRLRKSLLTIRDTVRKSGVPISHQTVRQVLARPEGAA